MFFPLQLRSFLFFLLSFFSFLGYMVFLSFLIYIVFFSTPVPSKVQARQRRRRRRVGFSICNGASDLLGRRLKRRRRRHRRRRCCQKSCSSCSSNPSSGDRAHARTGDAPLAPERVECVGQGLVPRAVLEARDCGRERAHGRERRGAPPPCAAPRGRSPPVRYNSARRTAI